MTVSYVSRWSQPALLALALLFAWPAHSEPSQADCNRVLAKELETRRQIFALREQQKIQEARSVARERVANIKGACGESNRSYAKALRDLADIELALNNPAEARELTQAALSIREVLADINPLDLMATRWQLAQLEMELGRYDVAKPLLESTLADVAVSPMKGTTMHADILQDQAWLQAWEGRIAEAETSLAEARQYVKLSGSLKSRVSFEAKASRVYRDVGLFDVAERYLRHVDTTLSSPEAINEFGQEGVNILHALINSALARVLVRKGQYEEAARIATDAVQTLLALPVEQRWMASGSRLSLAEAETARGRPAAALAQLDAALQHPLSSMQEAEFRHAMALAQGQLRRYPGALQNIARAVAIQRASTVPSLPRLIRYLGAEARLAWASGDIRAAHLHFKELQELFERTLLQNLAVLPEVRQRALLTAHADDMSAIVSFHFAVKKTLPESIGLAVDTVLQGKGRQLDSAAGRLALARMSGSATVTQTVDALNLLSAQIAAERIDTALTGGQGTSLRLKQLVRVREGFERKLQSQLPEYLSQRSQATASAIAAKLPGGAALVEYLRYKSVAPAITFVQRLHSMYRYAAFVITPQGGLMSIDLGEAARIDAMVGDWLRAIAARDQDRTQTLGRQVDAAILEPILQRIPDRKRIFVAPDGAIAGVPFAALVGSNGKCRVEGRYIFSYLTTGSDMLRPKFTTFSSLPPVVLGAPAFDVLPADLLMQGLFEGLADIGSPQRSQDSGDRKLPSAPDAAARTPEQDQAKADQLMRGAADMVRKRIGAFPDLPGAADEATAVAKRLGVSAIIGKDATKLQFQLSTLHPPRILHIASHAYVLKNDDAPETSGIRNPSVLFAEMDLPMETTATLDPMLRSGIVFAGVNRMDESRFGLVTALELSALDLSRTELVVLSACKTASGEVLPGEGVIGLRRALELSGANASITALWSLSDQPTVGFMDLFYERFLKPGKDKAEAVAEAQLAMLAKPATAAPALWAPFVLSGHTGP